MIYDFGINDSTRDNFDLKIYQLWTSMIRRCYSSIFLKNNPSYVGTTVCDDWKLYSNFHTWAKENYIPNYVLDKDIISGNLKIYSPSTCAFIPHDLNMCIIEPSTESQYPLGVTYEKKTSRMKNERSKPYRSKIMKYGKKHNIGILQSDILNQQITKTINKI